MPNDAESVCVRRGKRPENSGVCDTIIKPGFCVMRELDPGACAFSVDSVDWSPQWLTCPPQTLQLPFTTEPTSAKMKSK